MPEFLWRAAHADGQAAEGRTEAAAEADVLRQLRERGLTPIRVQPAGQAEGAALAGPRPRAARGPVKPADVLSLTSELAIMLRAGLALDAALRVLIDMSHKPSVRAMLEKVLEDVKGGAPFSRALAAHQAHFGDFYINMIRSGEVSGQMPQVLDRLAGHMQRLRALRESVVSATLYPAILLGVAVLSLVGMLGFVVPQFEKLFKDMGDALPMPTRVVMLLGQGFRHYGLALGLGAAALGWLAWRWLRTPAGRQWWQARLISRIVPAMRATGVFEPLAINLVRVGEETGRVGAMMNELAAILDRDVETGIKRGLTLLEPALILVLGLLIAAIIVSILLGIISVNDLVK